MGLDLALGGLVLVMAIRGWFRGFVLQAIRLGGVVVCVYAADPVRNVAKPEVMRYLPRIRPDLIDRMLWWSSAFATYILLVGIATLAVKIYRRQPYGLEERSRKDQFAGSLLGLAKGAVVAVFVVAGIQKYALAYLKNIPRAEQQVATSKALALHKQYRPVDRIWSAPPVQHFVKTVQRMGLKSPSESEKRTEPAETPAPAPAPVQTASRAPKLALPPLDTTGVDAEMAEAVRAVEDALRRAGASK
jgi:uncharacterized membrane protein required for colicin V production